MDPSAPESCRHQKASSPDNHHSCTPNAAIVNHSRQKRNRRGWRRIVLNFTPSWFSVNMGTGIVSILLHNLPYSASFIYWISVIIFVLNMALFALFLAISAARYTLFHGVWNCMVKHPLQSLFLGMCQIPPGLLFFAAYAVMMFRDVPHGPGDHY